jgi:hypothetical protein
VRQNLTSGYECRITDQNRTVVDQQYEINELRELCERFAEENKLLRDFTVDGPANDKCHLVELAQEMANSKGSFKFDRLSA